MTLEDNCTAQESDLVELFSCLSRYGVLAYLVKPFHQKTPFVSVTQDTDCLTASQRWKLEKQSTNRNYLMVLGKGKETDFEPGVSLLISVLT